MPVRFFVLLVLLGQLWVALPCQAAKWREVGKLPNAGVTVYIDDSSLEVDHDYVVKGWVRFDYASPRERDGYKLTGHTSRRMANCASGRYWVVEGWGNPVNSADPVPLYSDQQEWQVPAPDSEAEIAMAALCYETKSMFGVMWDALDVMMMKGVGQ